MSKLAARNKIVAFDLDGTLIEWPNSWDYLREVFGLKEKYYLDYFLGKMLYSDMKKLEWEVWKKINYTKDEIESLFDNIPYKKGSKDVIKELQRRGYIVGLISAAPNILVKKVYEDLKLDFYAASKILFDERGYIKGLILSITNDVDKAIYFDYFLYKYKADRKDSIAVGDSPIDALMLRRAGIGVYIAQNDYFIDTLFKKPSHNILIVRSLKEMLKILPKY